MTLTATMQSISGVDPEPIRDLIAEDAHEAPEVQKATPTEAVTSVFDHGGVRVAAAVCAAALAGTLLFGRHRVLRKVIGLGLVAGTVRYLTGGM